MALFESYERRIDKINSVLSSYGIASLEEAEKITKDAGLDVYGMVKGIQPICFENACWAYTVGAAIAIKKGCKKAADAAAIGIKKLPKGRLVLKILKRMYPATVGGSTIGSEIGRASCRERV